MRWCRPALGSGQEAGPWKKRYLRSHICAVCAGELKLACSASSWQQTPKFKGHPTAAYDFSLGLKRQVQHQAASRFGVWFTGDASCVLTEQERVRILVLRPGVRNFSPVRLCNRTFSPASPLPLPKNSSGPGGSPGKTWVVIFPVPGPGPSIRTGNN